MHSGEWTSRFGIRLDPFPIKKMSDRHPITAYNKKKLSSDNPFATAHTYKSKRWSLLFWTTERNTFRAQSQEVKIFHIFIYLQVWPPSETNAPAWSQIEKFYESLVNYSYNKRENLPIECTFQLHKMKNTWKQNYTFGKTLAFASAQNLHVFNLLRWDRLSWTWLGVEWKSAPLTSQSLV